MVQWPAKALACANKGCNPVHVPARQTHVTLHAVNVPTPPFARANTLTGNAAKPMLNSARGFLLLA
jgi:hypothetical protein